MLRSPPGFPPWRVRATAGRLGCSSIAFSRVQAAARLKGRLAAARASVNRRSCPRKRSGGSSSVAGAGTDCQTHSRAPVAGACCQWQTRSGVRTRWELAIGELQAARLPVRCSSVAHTCRALPMPCRHDLCEFCEHRSPPIPLIAVGERWEATA